MTGSTKTVRKGKKTLVKITSGDKTKITVVGKNKIAKNKKYVSKIKNGTTAAIQFTKNAKKGVYQFKVVVAAGNGYKETKKVISIKVK